MSSAPKLPLTLLRENVNKQIRVQLKDGTRIQGVLLSLDEYMNLLLKDAVELDAKNNPKVKWGLVLVRGNNILWVELLS